MIGVNSRAINNAQAGSDRERLVLIAGIGPGGAGIADAMFRMFDEGQALAFFGASHGSQAASLFMRTPELRRNIDLYALGLDTSGWTADSRDITWSGTTTASGTKVLRYGPHTVLIPLPKGADPTAQAAAANAAVNAAGIPLTSTVLLGVQTVTSTALGVSASRVPLTIDQYPDELGVPGSSHVIAVNTAGTGEPSSLSTAQQDAIRALGGALWVVQADRNSTWLENLDDELQSGWDDRNDYTLSFQAASTTTTTAFTDLIAPGGTPVNFRRTIMVGQYDAPEYELCASMRIIAAIMRARESFTPVRYNPGMVEVAIPGMGAPTVATTPAYRESVRQLGGSPMNANNGAFIELLVTTRVKNSSGQPDLSENRVASVLGQRYMLERVRLALKPFIGNIIVDDAVDIAEGAVNRAAIDERVTAELVALTGEGYRYGDPADTASMVNAVALKADGNIITGFSISYNAQNTTPTTSITATMLAS